MSFSIIAAVAENNVIGVKGGLPWNIPEDMKHFKKLTMGKTVLMGQNTWETLPEKFRPLPGRKNVVLTLLPEYPVPEDVEVYHSLEDAFAAHPEEVMVMGGASIYRQTLPMADKLYITHVHRSVDGDVTFPAIDPSLWKETSREDHGDFSFVTYERK
jgi:dihydrofolate reductase